MSGDAEVEGDGRPYEDGSEGGDEGHDGGGEGPEYGSGNAERPVGEAGEDALNGGDDEAAEGGGVDGVVEAVEEFGGFVFAEGQERAQEGEGLCAVAKEEEEDEEHDDELCEGVDGAAEEAAEMLSEVGCGDAGSVVGVD